MLASRARRKVRGTPTPERERRRQRAVVDDRIVELLTVSDRKRLDAMGLPARPE